MINLIGEYNCKADAKGRVMLPSAFKKQLATVLQEGFVLKQSIFESCLELYPMKEWSSTMAQVSKKNRFNKKTNDFIRIFSAGLKSVELDTTGRFLIPKNLCAYAGIKKEIVMSSSAGIIEIWDKDRYQDIIASGAQGFAELAEEVMGDFKGEEDE